MNQLIIASHIRYQSSLRQQYWQPLEGTHLPTIQELSRFLDDFAPTRLAEDWDNVGLLVGDTAGEVNKVMTCLTVTPTTAAEAIERSAQLIVTHHPLPFHSLKRITTETIPAKMLWQLIRAGVAIYSPHTGFDSAAQGINQSLARQMGLSGIKPLKPIVNDIDDLGSGRVGTIATITLQVLIDRLKECFGLRQIFYVGELDQPCCQVAVACGSGGSFLTAAAEAGCDTFVTGEATFHTCLDAKANNISMILLGHYASERFAVEDLAIRLQTAFPEIKVWPSESESDPISFR